MISSSNHFNLFPDPPIIATKPVRKPPTPLDVWIRDPKKKKPAYDQPSLIPMPMTGDSTYTNGSLPKPPVNRRKQPQPEKPSFKHKYTNDKSFDPDVKQIRQEDLLSVLCESKIHFVGESLIFSFDKSSFLTPQSSSSDAQSIWLKDMAAYLNHLLPYQLPSSTSSNLFSTSDSSYPSSLLKPGVRSFLTDLLDECANPTLQLFQSHCIDTVIRNIGMQLPVAGYLIMLQVLNRASPDVTRDNATVFTESIRVNKPRANVVIPLLWIACQSMVSSNAARHAASLWSIICQPMTGAANSTSPNIKSYNEFAINCLEIILRSTSITNDPEFKVSSDSFAIILDFLTAMSSSTLLGKRAAMLLPLLRSSALKPSSDPVNVKDIFSYYLKRLNENPGSTAQREEVMKVLTQCLIAHEDVGDHWIKLDQHRISNGSCMLLTHIANSNDSAKMSLTSAVSHFRALLEPGNGNSSNKSTAAASNAILVSCTFFCPLGTRVCVCLCCSCLQRYMCLRHWRLLAPGGRTR